MTRSLKEIAAEIRADWEGIDPYSLELLEAMESLQGIEDEYHADSGETVVGTFLANSKGWSGENARRIKSELKAMMPK